MQTVYFALTGLFVNYVNTNQKALNLKRVAAIFFLLVFLFNTGGYYLVFWCIKQQAKEDFLARLHASDYSQHESIILAIPFSLPYPVSDGSYQPVHGDFEYGGDYYKLVKQKLENDTLFVVCIKDKEARLIEESLSDYSKLANNLPVGSKQAFSFLAKIFKDYQSNEKFTVSPLHAFTSQQYFAVTTAPVQESHRSIDSPPPELYS
jgi:hypothetical protein